MKYKITVEPEEGFGGAVMIHHDVSALNPPQALMVATAKAIEAQAQEQGHDHEYHAKMFFDRLYTVREGDEPDMDRETIRRSLAWAVERQDLALKRAREARPFSEDCDFYLDKCNQESRTIAAYWRKLRAIDALTTT